MAADKVFISYSHDSPEHSAKVLALADALRAGGVDIELDRYHMRPPHGWPHWCEEQLRPEASRYVLVVCTANFRARVEDKVPADEGRGVFWEGALIYNYIYDAKGNTRFMPVLLDDESENGIPAPLNGHTRYRLHGFDPADPGFQALYRELTNQPEVVKAPLGGVVKLGSLTSAAAPKPALAVKSSFGDYDITRISAYAPGCSSAARRRRVARATLGEGGEGGGASACFGLRRARRRGQDVAGRDLRQRAGRTGWPGCEAAFAWSFYRQGTAEQAGGLVGLVLRPGARILRAAGVERESAYDKGKRLAALLADKRALLILDGL